MVTHSGGQTTNDLTDAFAVGFPVGITVKGSGRLAFDLEFVPQINTQKPRLILSRFTPALYTVWDTASEWEDG
jgi:hypothetical protein